jgi:translation initiation factor 1 (eIF-1/SUI1)
MPVISKVDAGAFFDVRVELERLRKTCPPNTSVTAGVVRVQGCAKELGKTCCAANGAMSPEVRRDLIRTAAEVMRVLTEKCQ